MAELMEKWWLELGNHHQSSTSQESGNSSQDAQKICFLEQKKEPCCSPISDSWWSSIILIYFDCVNPRFAMNSYEILVRFDGKPRGRYAWQPRDPKSGGEYAVRRGLCDSSSGAPCGWNGLAYVWLPHHTKTPGKLWLLQEICGELLVSSLFAELVGNINIINH